MPLSDAHRRLGRQGVAAARQAGHLDHDEDAEVHRLDEASIGRLVSSDLVDQARRVLNLTNADIADRTDLTMKQLARLDLGQPDVPLSTLIAVLVDQLGLRIVVEQATIPSRPAPDDPPRAAVSAEIDDEPQLSIRLPYRDD